MLCWGWTRVPTPGAAHSRGSAGSRGGCPGASWHGLLMFPLHKGEIPMGSAYLHPCLSFPASAAEPGMPGGVSHPCGISVCRERRRALSPTAKHLQLDFEGVFWENLSFFFFFFPPIFPLQLARDEGEGQPASLPARAGEGGPSYRRHSRPWPVSPPGKADARHANRHLESAGEL